MISYGLRAVSENIVSHRLSPKSWISLEYSLVFLVKMKNAADTELNDYFHLTAHDEKCINEKINEFFSEHDVDCPGVTAEDFTKAFIS